MCVALITRLHEATSSFELQRQLRPLVKHEGDVEGITDERHWQSKLGLYRNRTTFLRKRNKKGEDFQEKRKNAYN